MKIAILGSAPSSVALAPYSDQSWEIWGCSPAGVDHAKRISMWFELHPLTDPSCSPDYLRWMSQLTAPVALIQQDASIPTSFTYPREEMLAEFGPFFFTSSVAWMLAYAISKKPEEIGLWGVDMNASEEYVQQRPGCHFFIREALKAGIKVFIPSESDLCTPPALYGYVCGSRQYQKLMVRRRELVASRDAAAAEYENQRNRYQFFCGAIEDIDYQLRTWVQ